MGEYLPPPSNKLPFNFTESGYTAPGSSSLLFNFAQKGSFGTLKAAINVMQPYWETTHTYPKSCPKYVVGYGPGGVQIIKGRCLFGGIRDLQGIINGVDPGQVGVELFSSINGVLPSGQSNLGATMRITRPQDLPAKIDTHQPKDLSSSVEGIKFKGSGDLNSFLQGHTPRDLKAYLGAHAPADLRADIFGDIYHGDSTIGSTIDTHPPKDIPAKIDTHRPGNLGMLLRGWKYGAELDFPGLIHGWQQDDISAIIASHTAENLNVRLRGWAREVPLDLPAAIRGYTEVGLPASIGTHPYDKLRGIIRAWHREVQGNLPATIRMWQQEDMPAEIGTHIWGDLSAKVLPHPPPPIRASIRGWVREVTRDLTGLIHGWQEGDIRATIGAHAAGNLGIILRAWSYETPQDFPGLIHGWQELDLPSSIKVHEFGNLGIIMKGVVIGQPQDFPANIHGWQEGDLGVVTKGGHLPGDMKARVRVFQHEYRDLGLTLHSWQELDLQSIIETHQPQDIRGIIRGIARAYENLGGSTRGYQSSDLGFVVKGGHYPELLNAIIKMTGKAYGDLQGLIHGWEWRNLGMTLAGTHDPVDVAAYINPQERRERDVLASIYGWQSGNLPASLNIMYGVDLNAVLNSVVPANLSAYLKVRYISNLAASMHGYATSDLGAYLKRIYKREVSASINPLTDTYRDLPVKISISGKGLSDLGGFSRGMVWQLLNAILTPKYIANLGTYIFAIVPKDVKAKIHGWDTIDLPAILNVAQYPWNLTASITAGGYKANLGASIYKVAGSSVYRNLVMNVHGLDHRNFPAYIFADRTGNLSAYIEPYMQGSDLHASIRPKMIRLTTLVKVPTMVASDISAIINYPCFRTGYADLRALIYAKYKGDLYAYIKGRNNFAPPRDLGAKVGWTDGYLEVDKYKISVHVLPSSYFSEDIFKFKINALEQQGILEAYIRATPRFRNITASIIGDNIESYKYPRTFSNRERVIHKTYDGIFQAFEVVELAFKSAVSEYYYSTAGDIAFKADAFEKWMLDVRSILPQNLTIKLKRRLHRITTVYDFQRFNTVDEAVRYAIAHVTEWPEGNLGATIYNRARHEQLSAMIVPRYIRHEINYMSANITALQDTIVVGQQDGVKVIRK